MHMLICVARIKQMCADQLTSNQLDENKAQARNFIQEISEILHKKHIKNKHYNSSGLTIKLLC